MTSFVTLRDPLAERVAGRTRSSASLEPNGGAQPPSRPPVRPVGGVSTTRRMRRAVALTAGGIGLAAVTYGAYVWTAWCRYGHPSAPRDEEIDPLLDHFMAAYEVAERHHVRVGAPPAITLAAASDADLQQSLLVRGIFKAREWVLGSEDAVARPKGLIVEMESLGWRVLAERPGREVVVGAVTQPWMANVTFRGLAPHEFRAFHEPGYVKIVWTLRADPVGSSESMFRTETRVVTTDVAARRKFRWYWARFSPGIVLIRRAMLGNVKREAERRARLLNAADRQAFRQ